MVSVIVFSNNQNIQGTILKNQQARGKRTEGRKEGTQYIYPEKYNKKKKYKRMGIPEQLTRKG